MIEEISFPPLNKIYLPHHIPIHNNTDRYLLLYGGRGSGKSTDAAKKLVLRCLSEPYFKYILVRKIYNQIEESQYEDIRKAVEFLQVQDLFVFKKNPLTIECFNGNKFIARGLDKEDSTKSISEPTGIWYEEANQMKEQDFLASTTSIRTPKAEYLQEILTFNPECDGDPKDFWIYKRFFEGHDSKDFQGTRVYNYQGRDISISYTAIHSTHHMNNKLPDFGRATIEDAGAIDPYYYSVYVLGEWGQRKIENPFMSMYDPAKHEGKVRYRPLERLIMIVDFNVNPFCANFAHVFYDKDGEHCHIFEEISIPNGSITKMADEVKARYGEVLHMLEITGDMNGGARTLSKDNLSYFQQLRAELGLSSRQIKLKANPSHKYSRAHCNYVLRRHPDFKINPDTCPNTVRDMKIVEIDDRGSIKKQNRAIAGQQADHLDNVRYLINTYLPQYAKGILVE